MFLYPWHTYQKSAPKTRTVNWTINRHENTALSFSLPKTDTIKILSVGAYQIARQTLQKPVAVFWYRCSAPISGTCVIGIRLLTRHRKQALSTHAPQHPRKLSVETAMPMTTSTLARWPVMTSPWPGDHHNEHLGQVTITTSTLARWPVMTSPWPGDHHNKHLGQVTGDDQHLGQVTSDDVTWARWPSQRAPWPGDRWWRVVLRLGQTAVGRRRRMTVDQRGRTDRVQRENIHTAAHTRLMHCLHCHKGIRTFPRNIFPLTYSPGHFPSRTISPPFLHSVGHFPLPPPPPADLQYKAIYR